MRARAGGVLVGLTLILTPFGLARPMTAAEPATTYNAIPMAMPVDGYVPMGRPSGLVYGAQRATLTPGNAPPSSNSRVSVGAPPTTANEVQQAVAPQSPARPFPVQSASASQSSRRRSASAFGAPDPEADENEATPSATPNGSNPASSGATTAPTPTPEARAADPISPNSALTTTPSTPGARTNFAIDPNFPGDPGPLDSDTSILTGIREFFSGRNFPTEGFPAYTITATSLILHRTDAKSPALVQNASTGATLLEGQGLNPGWAVGPKFDVTMNFASGYQFEFIFFGLEGWHTSNTLTAAGNGLEVPIFSGDRFSHLETTYSSRLFNQELNSKHQLVGPINILSGFRAIELNENLSFAGSGSTTNGTANLKTRNWLLGLQIGAEASLVQRGRFSLDCFAKAGIYINPARLTTNQTGNVSLPSGSSDYAHEAFAGDVGLNANYFLGRGWTSTVGYQALWLDRVALAPNQAATLPNVNVNGDAFFQGVNLGLIKEF
jgi:hypothetical protein